jgi:ABC-type multidrug transport system fused ATPase/permease subunit
MTVENKRFMHWQRAIVEYFFPFIKEERAYLILFAVLNIITISTNTFLIWKIGTAVSQITSGEFAKLNHTLLVIAGIVLFNQLLRFIYAFNFQRMTLRFVDRVRGQLLIHIMTVSFPVFSKFNKGDLISRLTGDVDRILTFVVNVPLNVFTNIMVLCVYTSMLFWIDWQLALIALTMAPLFFLSQRFVAPKTGRASKHFVQERAKLVTLEEQTLANLKGISSFTSENFMRQKHREQFEVARKWALTARKIRIIYNAFFTFLVYFAGLVVIYSGIASIKSGHLTIGVLISFLVYIRNLTGPVRGLAQFPIQLQANRIAAERVMEVMSMPGSVQEKEAAPDIQIQQGDIVLDNVSFTYPQGEKPVFNKLSIAIHPGESVALVGASGSGKSTFAALLMRFFDPQSGAITIDGTDIKSVSLASLRKQISIVWQEPFIVDGSIKENLLLARPDATTEQMIDACKASFSWEFIEEMEQGLDTLIGTDGINLSVGQKQRLAIAQAFLRDSPILIFDEASSALDSHSERMIVQALQSLRENRTTLLIAHRFSSIRTAQRILYFNGNGSITTGSHEELMGSHEDYKEAVNWQVSRRE